MSEESELLSLGQSEEANIGDETKTGFTSMVLSLLALKNLSTRTRVLTYVASSIVLLVIIGSSAVAITQSIQARESADAAQRVHAGIINDANDAIQAGATAYKDSIAIPDRDKERAALKLDTEVLSNLIAEGSDEALQKQTAVISSDIAAIGTADEAKKRSDARDAAQAAKTAAENKAKFDADVAKQAADAVKEAKKVLTATVSKPYMRGDQGHYSAVVWVDFTATSYGCAQPYVQWNYTHNGVVVGDDSINGPILGPNQTAEVKVETQGLHEPADAATVMIAICQ
jgi:hypothetical protein